jgi:hypothetical protein
MNNSKNMIKINEYNDKSESSITRSMILFNPITWKEEIINQM